MTSPSSADVTVGPIPTMDATLTIVAHPAGPTAWTWRDSIVTTATAVQPPLPWRDRPVPLPWQDRPVPHAAAAASPPHRALAQRFCQVVAEILSARRSISQIADVFSDAAIAVLKAHHLQWRGLPLQVASLRVQCPGVHVLEVSARLSGGPDPIVLASRLVYDDAWRCMALLILATDAPRVRNH